jgi:hypothetical protein
MDIIQTTWYPISDVTPKNEVLLLWGNCYPVRVSMGWYEEDRAKKTPKPYWASNMTVMGVNWHRANAPTHWAPIPRHL